MALDELEKTILPKDWLREKEPMTHGVRLEVQKLVQEAFTLDNGVSPKVVVKSVALFRIDQVDESHVVAYAHGLLSSGAFISLLKFIEHFSWIKWTYQDMIEQFAATNSWPMAEQLLKIVQPTITAIDHRRLAISVVNMATEKQELKRAHRYIHQFGFQEDFPEIESLFRQEALDKLCLQRKWAIAANFVGNNTTLQVELFKKLVAAGEYVLANEQRERFQLNELVDLVDEDMPPVPKYLEFGNDEIVLCDSDSSIKFMQSYLDELLNDTDVSWVGLDVEWKAAFSKKDVAVASILQLAAGSKVFIIDFIALETSDFCFEYLRHVFVSADFVKVGFGFLTDLKVLQQSFPEKNGCFDTINSLVEIDVALRSVYTAYVGRSLSDATSFLLGKPLDKKEQLSNWDVRPLSDSQLKYAALDACCLTRMVRMLSKICPSLQSHSQVIHLTPITCLCTIEQSKKYRQGRQTVTDSANANPVLEFLELHPRGSEVTIWPSEVDRSQFQSHVFANSLCLIANGHPHIAILAQETRLDLSLLAKAAGVSRRKVRFAKPQECVQVFGFVPGTVPPVAHKSKETQIWIDKHLTHTGVFLFGGGPQCLLECSMQTLLMLLPDAKVVALSSDDEKQGKELESKFLADSMLGRVAKWLRMTGVDILHWDIMINPKKEDMLALATRENRIILTRDRKMAQQRAAFACYVVASDNVEEQFQEIKKHFGIEFHEAEFMSRCAKCNGKGFNIVDRAQVEERDDVPLKVLETVDEFYECKSCHQLYWVGPKYSTAHAKMKEIFK
ncbi:Aste57867_1496 [Aphanomyces stellatus]|uniref:Aste57867_1496 protein n=1 Tax=Aphanomyces stellatus TaxID=120398 RepID=A0A485K5T0_9STRA|nr:hypothetical protein As57867_001495 [Aphanomyces stellatus]VFT78712.1 Aste57867_1496 [Aphanomyces stellatus]